MRSPTPTTFDRPSRSGPILLWSLHFHCEKLWTIASNPSLSVGQAKPTPYQKPLTPFLFFFCCCSKQTRRWKKSFFKREKRFPLLSHFFFHFRRFFLCFVFCPLLLLRSASLQQNASLSARVPRRVKKSYNFFFEFFVRFSRCKQVFLCATR